MALSNETVWGLPGVPMAPPLPGAETFGAMPIDDLLRSAAGQYAAATAVVSLTASLSYAELLRLARNAAAAVAALVPRGQAIACLLPRSPEGVAGLLGCLLSGRICMVLDPAHPPDRLAALLAHAAPACLLVADAPRFTPGAPVLMLRDALAGPDRDWRAPRDWDPDAPFVVYFTSGSSGRPKGVVLSARFVLHRALDAAERWSLRAGDAVYCAAGHAVFALSALLGALHRGARVLLTDVATDGIGGVLRLIDREAMTCADIMAPVLRVLLQTVQARAALRTLRVLRIGSAALSRADLAAWRMLLPPGCTILHTYASTEAHVIAAWVVPVNDSGPETTVAAGTMQGCHEFALVDEDDRRVGPGEPGELVLRGRYLALGEWQGGRLVPGRMPPVPGRSGWRSFRTGDVVLIQPDGMLRVLGRADRQVKVNGVRVEPAEIETVLRSEPGVMDAVVLADTRAGRVMLSGFVAAGTADRDTLVAALRTRLAAELPASCRPTRLTVLDRLPTLPGGKIDAVSLLAGVKR